jgi:hypothetical protein
VCSATNILPGAEGFYADARTARSGAARIFKAKGSQADREMFHNGIVGPKGPWPPQALDNAFTLAGAIFIGAAGQYLMGLSQLVTSPMALYGFQVVTRSLVESASHAWWVLDPQIEARERVARAAVERWYSVQELGKVERVSGREVLERDDRALNLRVQLAKLGLEEDVNNRGRLIGWEGVRQPEATRVVTRFLSELGLRNGEFWYRTLSGVSHSTLYAVLQYQEASRNPHDERATMSPNLPLAAVVNAAALGTSSYLGVVARHAYLYGRDWEAVDRMRFRTVGSIFQAAGAS